MGLKAGQIPNSDVYLWICIFAYSVPREIFEITFYKLSFEVNQHFSTELSITEA